MAFDPNPLFFKMVSLFKENYSPEKRVEIYNEGSTRCFGPKTKVFTNNGYKLITEVVKGDKVLTYNEDSNKKEFKVVNETLKLKNQKQTFKVKLKDGTTIIATHDHQFFYKGTWVSLKHLLSLSDEKRNMETNPKL